MKTIFLKILFRFMLLISVLLGLAMGCTKESKDQNIPQILSLNEIPVIINYEQLSLINTDWKLIGFGLAAESTIRIAEPKNESCYRLILKSDGTFTEQTSTNSKKGKYEVNMQNSALKILSSEGTEINELYDGKIYVETMLKIESFSITERGLALYYNNKTHYLLFKPIGI